LVISTLEHLQTLGSVNTLVLTFSCCHAVLVTTALQHVSGSAITLASVIQYMNAITDNGK
jgi:hypothetical protein